MDLLKRVIVTTLILCLSRTPLPWGHSHSELDQEILISHLNRCHPATRESNLPLGWHWHFGPLESMTDDTGSRLPLVESGVWLESILFRTLVLSNSICVTTPDRITYTDITASQSNQHCRKYLLLNVLLM